MLGKNRPRRGRETQKVLRIAKPKKRDEKAKRKKKDFTKNIYLSGTSAIERAVEVNLLALRGFIGWRPSKMCRVYVKQTHPRKGRKLIPPT